VAGRVPRSCACVPTRASDGVALVPRRGSAVVVADAVEADLARRTESGRVRCSASGCGIVIWELDRTEECRSIFWAVVDTALWDLAGRFYGAPVWELTRRVPPRIPGFASNFDVRHAGDLSRGRNAGLELGYPALKAPAWVTRADRRQLCTAVREHVGDDVPLMYDGSAAFDLADRRLRRRRAVRLR